jgi:hypothetical protein
MCRNSIVNFKLMLHETLDDSVLVLNSLFNAR